MEIKKAEFLQSNSDLSKLPKPDRPEYAFIGRSNVGKSSLINMLTQKPGLAKTSQKPGKTQLINHFLINDTWYLVDLPGYGWAQVSKEKRDAFDKMIRGYISDRTNMICLFVLIDSRLEPQKVDLEFMEWLATAQIPFVIIFTKADKQSVSRTKANVESYKEKMLETWEELPHFFVTSSADRTGREELLSYIAELNHNYKTFK